MGGSARNGAGLSLLVLLSWQLARHCIAGLAQSIPAFRLLRTSTAFELQTATYLLRSPGFEVDLISVVHLADASYFHGIQRDAQKYDRFLFELILDGECTSVDEGGMRRVRTDLQPTPEQVLLARSYGLCAQLECLDCRRSPKWVLADLPRDEILRIQQQHQLQLQKNQQLQPKQQQNLPRSVGVGGLGRGNIAAAPLPPPPPPQWLQRLGEVGQAVTVGRSRASGGRVLPRFFVAEAFDLAALFLRSLLWLTPCPEAELLLLDWSKAYPKAGGVAVALSAMADCLLAGDFAAAKKLGFAQQLVSSQAANVGGGLPAAGSGAAAALAARNAAAVRQVEVAAADGCRSVGLLYGGHHAADLRRLLKESAALQLQPTGVQWRTAWEVPLPAAAVARRSGRKAERRFAEEDAEESSEELSGAEKDTLFLLQEGKEEDEREPTAAELVKRHRALLALVAAYVALGAWDWADTLRRLAAAAEAADVAAVAAVAALYVARHAYLYYGLSKSFVQWDGELFEG